MSQQTSKLSGETVSTRLRWRRPCAVWIGRTTSRTRSVVGRDDGAAHRDRRRDLVPARGARAARRGQPHLRDRRGGWDVIRRHHAGVCPAARTAVSHDSVSYSPGCWTASRPEHRRRPNGRRRPDRRGGYDDAPPGAPGGASSSMFLETRAQTSSAVSSSGAAAPSTVTESS